MLASQVAQRVNSCNIAKFKNFEKFAIMSNFWKIVFLISGDLNPRMKVFSCSASLGASLGSKPHASTLLFRSHENVKVGQISIIFSFKNNIKASQLLCCGDVV